MNIRNSSHSNKTSTAMMLAQDKLSDMILKYKNKPLTEIPEKEEGTFEGEYAKYKWEVTSRDFKYDLSFLAQMGKEKQKDEETPESPLSPYLPKISDYIKRASKELSVSVMWKEGATEYKEHLTTHVFDYKVQVGL